MGDLCIVFVIDDIGYRFWLPKNSRRFKLTCEGVGVTRDFKKDLKNNIDYDDGIFHFDNHIILSHSASNGAEAHCISIVKVIQYLSQFPEFVEQFKYKTI